MPRKLLHALLKLPESEASGLILIQPSIDIVDLVRQILRVLERHQTLGQWVQAPGINYEKISALVYLLYKAKSVPIIFKNRCPSIFTM